MTPVNFISSGEETLGDLFDVDLGRSFVAILS